MKLFDWHKFRRLTPLNPHPIIFGCMGTLPLRGNLMGYPCDTRRFKGPCDSEIRFLRPVDSLVSARIQSINSFFNFSYSSFTAGCPGAFGSIGNLGFNRFPQCGTIWQNRESKGASQPFFPPEHSRDTIE